MPFRVGYREAKAAGAFLRGLPHVAFAATTTEVIKAAWRVFAESRGKLSYPDAVVVATCRRERCGVLTFDRGMRRAVG